MARHKKNCVPFNEYETPNLYDEKYIRITRTMLNHKNFIALSNNAKILYIYMRDWGYPVNKVNYSISLSKKLMSKNTFLKCIKELEYYGFIKTTWSNKFSHKPNEYTFIPNWYKGKN